MKIDNTTIELISDFGKTLIRETKDGIPRSNVNINKDYFCVIMPRMIMLYDNPSKADDNEFTIPDVKLLGTINKASLKNDKFVLEKNEELGSAYIKASSANVGVINLEPDYISKKELDNMINEPELGSFLLDVKDTACKPFSFIVSQIKDDKLIPYINFNSVANENKKKPSSLSLLDEPVEDANTYDENKCVEVSMSYKDTSNFETITGANGDFDFYLNVLHLSEISYNGPFSVSVKKSFAVLSYAGASKELQGLKYILSCYKKQ